MNIINHFIEVKEIEIPEMGKTTLIENFPESGFWLVNTKTASNLMFVDKEGDIIIFICPKHVFKAMGIDRRLLPKQEETTNITTPPGYVSELFVLDFAKLLLSKK